MTEFTIPIFKGDNLSLVAFAKMLDLIVREGEVTIMIYRDCKHLTCFPRSYILRETPRQPDGYHYIYK